MFFSPELLERRDSGYGLLWLAATLGAKSSFKKLPKRSVLTADISQLCGLIAEPSEPLALRLSSNLMIGVARVYKVKEEIFFTDVTTCYNSLKKAVHELSAFSANAAELQMGQPSLRAEALTLTADPGAAFGLNFDRIFVTWDDKAQEDAEGEDDSDDDFDPRSKKPKSQRKQAQSIAPLSATAEQGRALHTLDEPHTQLLAAAFDGSMTASVQGGAGFAASSSQVGGGFDFDDNLFALPEGAGGADIGDELALELGEGWGAAFDLAQGPSAQVGNADLGLDLGMDQGLGDDFHFDIQHGVEMQPPVGTPDNAVGRESLPPNGSVIVPLAPFSPRDSVHSDPAAPVQRKGKRVRLLLDSRIELTDEELKMARANYVQEQEALKRGAAQKKAEKESGRLIEEMINGAPRGVHAPVLVDFWLENFRLQVNARSGQLHMEMEGEPPKKRRKVHDTEPGREASSPVIGDDHNMDVDQPVDFGGGFGDFQTGFDLDARMRSSEEPGQARRGSRPPSAMGSHLDFDLRPTQDIISGSQRSGLYPWDHAGPSSSVGGGAFAVDGSDVFSAMRPASKRGSSFGRDSFLVPGGGTVPPSPINFGLGSSQIGGEDFQFEVAEETNEESQQSVLTLEKNSFNFLEYAKMQLTANPSVNAELAFDDVVPKATSTRRVAAAAFYHCLVLTTKNLLSVRQEEPYGELKVRMK
ncbi:hypothetical protein K466DRAFT_594355 [Polyporus arcularius HHB13444]|uniref:Rad21/Rec8-like protein N-terminal domain-containing protein n=1 Tax=Polyporus arcularius HHB13444 TaxID=1314778 RepID=A0A5C3Q004_9APHY|nr:hypothetical protein K466DRAFT_594355 [Polyporus arcularius HHB13444]